MAHTPSVIMVTAFGREEAQRSGQPAGIHLPVVLTKPVTPSTLLEAIGDGTRQGRAQADTRASADRQSASAMASLRGARLLLVEDNELNQELALRAAGERRDRAVPWPSTAQRRSTCWSVTQTSMVC